TQICENRRNPAADLLREGSSQFLAFARLEQRAPASSALGLQYPSEPPIRVAYPCQGLRIASVWSKALAFPNKTPAIHRGCLEVGPSIAPAAQLVSMMY